MVLMSIDILLLIIIICVFYRLDKTYLEGDDDEEEMLLFADALLETQRYG